MMYSGIFLLSGSNIAEQIIGAPECRLLQESAKARRVLST